MPEPQSGSSPSSSSSPAHSEKARRALYYGLGAYTLWGIFPLYFKVVAHIAPWIVLCHRVIWSVGFLAGVISFRSEWQQIRRSVASPRTLALLGAGSLLIAANWLIFIYAVGRGKVLEASLGYFINPLLSIALGMIFLRERLRPLQWVAVLVAAGAVLQLTLSAAGVPWIALSLAATFGFYGLVRKKVDVNSLHGLLVETILLLPLSLGVIWLVPAAREVTAVDVGLLSLSGVITAIPLLMFGAAVRGLKLSTIGFLQYIGPTLQFLLAVLLLGEKLDVARLTGFVICWVAIAIYVLDSALNRVPQPIADKPE